jgi:hypothetical protein
MKMKKFGLSLVLIVALVLMVGTAWAQDSQPSAKAAAIINKLYAIPMTAADSLDWVTVHSQTIKTANAKDLFMDVALQCGIFTQTKSQLKVGGDSSTATGQIEVRVMVDADMAEPGVVVYDKRVQTLNTELYQALWTATGMSIDNIGYVELILETLQAHAFNFVMTDLSSGVHTITVQAKVTSTASANATAMAAVGMGSTTIESVRMIKGEEIIYMP